MQRIVRRVVLVICIFIIALMSFFFLVLGARVYNKEKLFRARYT